MFDIFPAHSKLSTEQFVIFAVLLIEYHAQSNVSKVKLNVSIFIVEFTGLFVVIVGGVASIVKLKTPLVVELASDVSAQILQKYSASFNVATV